MSDPINPNPPSEAAPLVDPVTGLPLEDGQTPTQVDVQQNQMGSDPIISTPDLLQTTTQFQEIPVDVNTAGDSSEPGDMYKLNNSNPAEPANNPNPQGVENSVAAGHQTDIKQAKAKQELKILKSMDDRTRQELKEVEKKGVATKVNNSALFKKIMASHPGSKAYLDALRGKNIEFRNAGQSEGEFQQNVLNFAKAYPKLHSAQQKAYSNTSLIFSNQDQPGVNSMAFRLAANGARGVVFFKRGQQLLADGKTATSHLGHEIDHNSGHTLGDKIKLMKALGYEHKATEQKFLKAKSDARFDESKAKVGEAVDESEIASEAVEAYYKGELEGPENADVKSAILAYIASTDNEKLEEIQFNEFHFETDEEADARATEMGGSMKAAEEKLKAAGLLDAASDVASDVDSVLVGAGTGKGNADALREKAKVLIGVAENKAGEQIDDLITGISNEDLRSALVDAGYAPIATASGSERAAMALAALKSVKADATISKIVTKSGGAVTKEALNTIIDDAARDITAKQAALKTLNPIRAVLNPKADPALPVVAQRAAYLKAVAKSRLDQASANNGNLSTGTKDDRSALLDKINEEIEDTEIEVDGHTSKMEKAQDQLEELAKSGTNTPEYHAKLQEFEKLQGRLDELNADKVFLEGYDEMIELTDTVQANPGDAEAVLQLNRIFAPTQSLPNGTSPVRAMADPVLSANPQAMTNAMMISSGSTPGQPNETLQDTKRVLQLTNETLGSVGGIAETVGGIMALSTDGEMDLMNSSLSHNMMLNSMQDYGNERVKQKKMDKIIAQLLAALASGNMNVIPYLLILIAAQSKKTMLKVAHSLGKHLVTYEKEQRKLSKTIARQNPKAEKYQSNMMNLQSDQQMISSKRQMVINGFREVITTVDELESMAKSYLDNRGPQARQMARWT